MAVPGSSDAVVIEKRGSPVRSNLSANVLIAALTFLTSVTQARALDPTGRGELAIFLLWPGIVAHLSMMGTHLYLARESGRNPANVRQHYRLGYMILATFCSVASLAWVGICLTTPVLGSPLSTTVIVLTALIIPLTAWNAMQVQIELGRSSFQTYNLARIGFSVIYVVLILALSAANLHSATAFLAAFTAAAGIAAIGAQIVIARSVAQTVIPQTVQRSPTLVQLWEGAWPYAISTALLAVSSMVDRMVISTFFDARTMGLYVVAIAMSQLQSVINEAISPLFFARSGQVKAMATMDREWLFRRLRQTIIINAIISLFLVAAVPILLPLIFGKAYSGAMLIALLLVPAAGLRSMMRPFEEVLKGSGQANSQSVAIFSMMGVFLAGGLVAIMNNSIPGVAGSMILAALAGLFIVAGRLAQILSVPMKTLLAPRLGDLVALRYDIQRFVRI
jgi:O-antigen/teichoic acid export membrane protein